MASVPSIRVLSKTIPIEFQMGEGADRPLDRAGLLAGAERMADLINEKSADLTQEQKNAFEGIKKIVFFEGKVMVDGHLMDRPCCDQDDAIFYWEANEFEQNSDADVRANTFFHDCWHVVQFRRDGGFARDQREQVAREVDAIQEQIKVARILGNDEREIRFLENFRDNQQGIIDRLREGVGSAFAAHRPGDMRGG